MWKSSGVPRLSYRYYELDSMTLARNLPYPSPETTNLKKKSSLLADELMNFLKFYSLMIMTSLSSLPSYKTETVLVFSVKYASTVALPTR